MGGEAAATINGGKKSDKSAEKHLTWDEHAIEEHDLLRGTRMKVRRLLHLISFRLFIVWYYRSERIHILCSYFLQILFTSKKHTQQITTHM